MAKTTVKLIDITGLTATQIESALSNALSRGSTLLQIVEANTRTFAILSKTITI